MRIGGGGGLLERGGLIEDLRYVFVAFDISRYLNGHRSAEHRYLRSNVRALVLFTFISIVNKHQNLKTYILFQNLTKFGRNSYSMKASKQVLNKGVFVIQTTLISMKAMETMCRFIRKSNDWIFWKLNKFKILGLFSIIHVTMC